MLWQAAHDVGFGDLVGSLTVASPRERVSVVWKAAGCILLLRWWVQCVRLRFRRRTQRGSEPDQQAANVNS